MEPALEIPPGLASGSRSSTSGRSPSVTPGRATATLHRPPRAPDEPLGIGTAPPGSTPRFWSELDGGKQECYTLARLRSFSLGVGGETGPRGLLQSTSSPFLRQP
jgi:hypothetical protein